LFPLDLDTAAEEVALIEEIVRVWMFQNRVTDVQRLYFKSRITPEAEWYYDKVADVEEPSEDDAEN
jgi:hypothetical protein